MIAADESIRKADDPLHVVRAHAADGAVVKVAPLGGVRPLLDIAAQIERRQLFGAALKPRQQRELGADAGRFAQSEHDREGHGNA